MLRKQNTPGPSSQGLEEVGADESEFRNSAPTLKSPVCWNTLFPLVEPQLS